MINTRFPTLMQFRIPDIHQLNKFNAGILSVNLNNYGQREKEAEEIFCIYRN